MSRDKSVVVWCPLTLTLFILAFIPPWWHVVVCHLSPKLGSRHTEVSDTKRIVLGELLDILFTLGGPRIVELLLHSLHLRTRRRETFGSIGVSLFVRWILSVGFGFCLVRFFFLFLFDTNVCRTFSTTRRIFPLKNEPCHSLIYVRQN